MSAITNLLSVTRNGNPEAGNANWGATTAAIPAGAKVGCWLFIPNSDPTGLTVSVDGQALTEYSAARSTRSNKTILFFWLDDTAGRASGKTVAATWTNTGTQNGGGAALIMFALTPTNAFATGGPERGNVGNGLSQAPSTGSSGTPTDTTADYVACAGVGHIFNTTGSMTPGNSYAALTEAANTTRNVILNAAALEFTSAPVAAKTETWTVTWGANKDWVAAIVLFKETTPSAPTNTVAPAVTGTETVGSTLSCGPGTFDDHGSTITGRTYQWQRDLGTSGVTWVDIAGATSTTYVVQGSGIDSDIGSKIRCRVIAANANGNSDPAASNTTSVTIPAPAGISWRVVAGPVAQSDNQTHSQTLTKPVLAGEKVVVFIACSNANTIDGNSNQSDAGSITDDGGLTWTQDAEAFSDTSIQHSCQAFSALAGSGLPYGSAITMHVWGVSGAGAYHGQSPFWFAVAINSGDGSPMVVDQHAHQVDLLTTHVAPSVTTAATAVVFGFHAGEPGSTAGWWTPASGFTEIADTAAANTLGGESAYNISAEAQVVSSPYTGGAGGVTGSNKTITNLVISYKKSGSSVSGAAALAGTGALAATGTRTRLAAAAVSATATLAVAGVVSRFAAAALAALGALSAAGTRTRQAAAALAGNGALSATGSRTTFGAASLTGTGLLTVVTGAGAVTGAAALQGVASLSTSGIRTRSGQAALVGSSATVAAGTRIRFGAAVLGATGEIDGTGVRGTSGAASIAAFGAALAAGIRSRFGAAAIAAIGSLVGRGTNPNDSTAPVTTRTFATSQQRTKTTTELGG